MKPLPATVRRGLRATVESHPDVNLLAAFSERTLANPERDLVLGHLARCAECREVVTLAIPLLAPIQMEVRPARSWRPVLAWSGLAACAAIAAGVLWMPRTGHETYIQQAKNEAPVIQKAITPPSSSPVPQLPAPPAVKDKSEESAKLSTLGKLQSSPATRDRAVGQTEPMAAMQKDEKTSSEPVPQMRESFAAAAAPNAEIANKISLDDRYPHWTLNSDGTLLRSLNAASAWKKVEVPGNTAMLHAIATIGPEVWVGGSGGVIYHSADTGSHWQHVTPSFGGQTLADDVIGIAFTTPQQGKLTTRQQQVWTTSDGGKTWTLQ